MTEDEAVGVFQELIDEDLDAYVEAGPCVLISYSFIILCSKLQVM